MANHKQSVDMYRDDRLRVVTISHEAGLGRHEREIGDGGGHQQLQESLRPNEVARLAHTELYKPRQPVFGCLT